MKKGYYTVKEVSEITGQHPNTVRSKIKKGLYIIMARSNPSEPFLIAKKCIDGSKNL